MVKFQIVRGVLNIVLYYRFITAHQFLLLRQVLREISVYYGHAWYTVIFSKPFLATKIEFWRAKEPYYSALLGLFHSQGYHQEC